MEDPMTTELSSAFLPISKLAHKQVILNRSEENYVI